MRKACPIFLGVLVICLIAVPSLSFGGVAVINQYALRANYSSSNEALDNETHFYGISFQVKSKTMINDSFDFTLDGRLGTDGLTRAGYENSQLRELFVRHVGDRFDLVAGRKVYSWGKADAINPVDVVSAKDYLTLLPESSDQRKGSDSFALSYFFDNGMAIDVVAVTRFEPSDIILPDGFGVGFIVDEQSDISVKDPALGVKVSGGISALDWSVYGYDGQSNLPEAYAYGNAGPPLLMLRYPDLAMIGMDLAGAFDRYTYRAEMALKDYDGVSGSGFGQYLNLVAGLERKYGNYLNLNVQYILNRNLGSEPENASSMESFFNDLVQFSAGDITQGVTFRLANAWRNGYLKAEIFSVYYFDDESYFYQLQSEYVLSDEVLLKAGYRGYGGDAASMYGVYKENSRFFLECRYSF